MSLSNSSIEIISILEPHTRSFYCDAMSVLERAGVPFMVGGAYAFSRYTDIERHTKDFDIFLLREDRDAALETLRKAGYPAHVQFPHWIAKAHCGDDFVDLIYGSGNGLVPVDREWFQHAVPEIVLGLPALLIPAEEMIWSKSFIQERERFDGADVAHLLLARAEVLDWTRLLRRFRRNWRVLFQHLVSFGYVYPSERHRIPPEVMRFLMDRLDAELETHVKRGKLCRGTVLSRQQYLPDVVGGGFRDVRRQTENPMTEQDIQLWTAGIAIDG